MTKLGTYQNGNFTVTIYDDGTKIRETNEDKFVPAFAESCDITITNRCDGGCEFCYQGCTPSGKHGRLLNYKLLDSLHPYTEVAIGGNDLSHPELFPFLQELKNRKVIANITINQKHFEKDIELIKLLTEGKYIYGLGISLVDPTEDFIAKVKQFPNAVIHVINGIVSMEDLFKLFNHDLKLLILGYKQLGRGRTYSQGNELLKHRQKELYTYLPSIIQRFKVVSFDNLALKQLDVRSLMTDEEWNEFYMGDDAEFTFYIDLVNGYFAKSSLDMENHYPLMDNIDDMFKAVKGK